MRVGSGGQQGKWRRSCSCTYAGRRQQQEHPQGCSDALSTAVGARAQTLRQPSFASLPAPAPLRHPLLAGSPPPASLQPRTALPAYCPLQDAQRLAVFSSTVKRIAADNADMSRPLYWSYLTQYAALSVGELERGLRHNATSVGASPPVMAGPKASGPLFSATTAVNSPDAWGGCPDGQAVLTKVRAGGAWDSFCGWLGVG